MEKDISYPKVSSMKPAPNPFLIIESKKAKAKKQEEAYEDEVNVTESSFSLSSSVTGIISFIVASIIGVAVILPTITSVVETSNLTTTTTDLIISLAPLLVAVVVIISVIGVLFKSY